MRIVALHGFLGRPKDFAPLGLSLTALNLFRTQLGPMESWVKRFNRVCDDQVILLGYSMGARLALQCALQMPQKYRALVIVAGHPGLRALRDRHARLLSDHSWAEKFLTMPWKDLMTEWNNAPALKSSSSQPRQEQDFCRNTLANALRRFSLGHQDFLIPKINLLNMPILWLAPISEIANTQGLHLTHAHSKLCFAPDGGHRFMFDYPMWVSRRIVNFLRGLTINSPAKSISGNKH